MTTVAYVGIAGLVGALGWTLWVGSRRRDAAVAVNAVAALGAVALPTVLEGFFRVGLETDVSLGPTLTLWIAVAGVLHMLGMLGWYDERWWWDHLTHTVSAALVAAVVYAGVLVAGPPAVLGPVRGGAAVWTVGLTMVAGVAWECLELAARALSDRVGVDPVLEYYGRFDTPLDLVFDAVGVACVLALDVRLFVPAFEPIPDLTGRLLAWSLAVLAVGTLLSAAVVVADRVVD